MSRAIRNTVTLIAATSFALSGAACGTTAGGGGGAFQTVGGQEGVACDPVYFNEGCNGAKRMKCATDKWAIIAECPTGQY